MDQKQVFQHPRKQRYLLLIIVLGLAALAGVWAAIRFVAPNQTQQTTQQSEDAPAIIEQIQLGEIVDPQQVGNRLNPPLRESTQYQAGQPLALKTVTAAEIKEPVEINVRLLTTARETVALDPSSIEIQPGTSTFCCWEAPPAGNYLFQIFRPEGTITSIPIRTIKTFQQNQLSL